MFGQFDVQVAEDAEDAAHLLRRQERERHPVLRLAGDPQHERVFGCLFAGAAPPVLGGFGGDERPACWLDDAEDLACRFFHVGEGGVVEDAGADCCVERVVGEREVGRGGDVGVAVFGGSVERVFGDVDAAWFEAEFFCEPHVSACAAADVEDTGGAAFLDGGEEPDDMLGRVAELVSFLPVKLVPGYGRHSTPIP